MVLFLFLFQSTKQGPYDKKLIIGSVLFGVGWGLTGMCPGPLIVGLVADFNQLATGAPPTGGPVLCLVFVILGQFFAAWFKLKYCSVGPAAQNATIDELRKALLNGGTILDVRNADERAVGTDGIFTMFEGTISAQYDRSTDTLPIKCLPENVGKYKNELMLNELMFYVASLTSFLFFSFLFPSLPLLPLCSTSTQMHLSLFIASQVDVHEWPLPN